MQRCPNSRQVNWAARANLLWVQTESRIQVRFWVEFEDDFELRNFGDRTNTSAAGTNTSTATWARERTHTTEGSSSNSSSRTRGPVLKPGPSSGPEQFLLFCRAMRMRRRRENAPHHTILPRHWSNGGMAAPHKRRTLRTHLSPRSHPHLPHAHARRLAPPPGFEILDWLSIWPPFWQLLLLLLCECECECVVFVVGATICRRSTRVGVHLPPAERKWNQMCGNALLLRKTN